MRDAPPVVHLAAERQALRIARSRPLPVTLVRARMPRPFSARAAVRWSPAARPSAVASSSQRSATASLALPEGQPSRR